jgi:predicted permease
MRIVINSFKDFKNLPRNEKLVVLLILPLAFLLAILCIVIAITLLAGVIVVAVPVVLVAVVLAISVAIIATVIWLIVFIVKKRGVIKDYPEENSQIKDPEENE